MNNPYEATNFFGFFLLFFQRMGAFLSGHLSLNELASDEIQVGILAILSASSSLVGVFLVLKKMTMLANSLSHTILLGIVLSVLLVHGSVDQTMSLPRLFIAAILASCLTTFLTQWMTHVMRLQEDASIGLVFTTLFALSVVLVTAFTRSTHLGIEAVMGNSDALHIHDFKLVSAVLLIDGVVIFLFFKELLMTTFDVGFTQSLGFSATLLSYLLMLLTAVTVVSAFRAVGVLLVLGLLVGPVLTSRLLVQNVKKMIFFSMGIGSLSALIGVALSRHVLSVHQIPLSTSGLVVCVIGVFYLTALFSQLTVSKIKRSYIR